MVVRFHLPTFPLYKKQMSNNERRQTGGRIGSTDFSAIQPPEILSKTKDTAPESIETSDTFSGNVIKFTKTISLRND